MSEQLWAAGSLFISAFVSATLAPGGSEAVLVYWVSESIMSSELLIWIATVGNTLGAITTWGMGMLLAIKFPLGEGLSANNRRAVAWVRKWGRWSLFFSWLPLIGDALCFAGGWLKLPMVSSYVIIFFGKALRYALVVMATNLVI